MSLASAAARRYAEAFVETAAEKGDETLQSVRQELSAFAAAVDEVFDLSNLLMNPAVTADERVKVLDRVMEEVGLSDLTKRFLHLLAEKDRINEIREIAHVYDQLADARTGRVQAEITSAIELSDATTDQLRRALEKRTGKKIEMNVSVDESLIGGIKAQVGSFVFDGTIRSELDRLRDSLEAVD
jgi:F-type H+-transporting ATPase subunit delta